MDRHREVQNVSWCVVICASQENHTCPIPVNTFFQAIKFPLLIPLNFGNHPLSEMRNETKYVREIVANVVCGDLVGGPVFVRCARRDAGAVPVLGGVRAGRVLARGARRVSRRRRGK